MINVHAVLVSVIDFRRSVNADSKRGCGEEINQIVVRKEALGRSGVAQATAHLQNGDQPVNLSNFNGRKEQNANYLDERTADGVLT